MPRRSSTARPLETEEDEDLQEESPRKKRTVSRTCGIEVIPDVEDHGDHEEEVESKKRVRKKSQKALESGLENGLTPKAAQAGPSRTVRFKIDTRPKG